MTSVLKEDLLVCVDVGFTARLRAFERCPHKYDPHKHVRYLRWCRLGKEARKLAESSLF